MALIALVVVLLEDARRRRDLPAAARDETRAARDQLAAEQARAQELETSSARQRQSEGEALEQRAPQTDGGRDDAARLGPASPPVRLGHGSGGPTGRRPT